MLIMDVIFSNSFEEIIKDNKYMNILRNASLNIKVSLKNFFIQKNFQSCHRLIL